MASVATTNISNITRLITGNKGISLNIGGGAVPCEVFRIASGQTTGDTAVLVPVTFKTVMACLGPVTDALGSTGATSVTVTLIGGTATIAAFTVMIMGPVPATN